MMMKNIFAAAVIGLAFAPAAKAALLTYDISAGRAVSAADPFSVSGTLTFDDQIMSFVSGSLTVDGLVEFTDQILIPDGTVFDVLATAALLPGRTALFANGTDLSGNLDKNPLVLFEFTNNPPSEQLLVGTDFRGFTIGTGAGACTDQMCTSLSFFTFDSDSFSASLRTSEVPLPATAWLMIAALGVGALIRRKA